VNNLFDRGAAEALYDFCFEAAPALGLHVVSRFAVPLLPMRLARSFATRTDCPVMRYLADAQSLGLVGLWQRLCAGQLPARCSKAWFFETFCNVSPADFQRLDASGALGPAVDIRAHLNGFVKPYGAGADPVTHARSHAHANPRARTEV
jgi:hypothetical protein